MRTATAIRTGLVLAVAVVFGLMVPATAHALWNVFVPSNAGTIQAANFLVEVSASPDGNVLPMVPNSNIALGDLGVDLADLYPGASVTAGVQVKNATNASSDFKIRVTVEEPLDALPRGLTFDYGTANNVAECATTSYTSAQQEFAVDIPKGELRVICFKTMLAVDAPVTMMNQTYKILVPLQAAQTGRTP